jgi:hypothetical protein
MTKILVPILVLIALADLAWFFCALASTDAKCRRTRKQGKGKTPDTVPEEGALTESTNIGGLRRLLDVAERHGLGPIVNAAYSVSFEPEFFLNIQGRYSGEYGVLVEAIAAPMPPRGWEKEEDCYKRKTVVVEEFGVKYYFRIVRW